MQTGQTDDGSNYHGTATKGLTEILSLATTRKKGRPGWDGP